MNTSMLSMIVKVCGELNVISIVDIIDGISRELPEGFSIMQKNVSLFSEGRISISVEFEGDNATAKALFVRKLKEEMNQLSRAPSIK